MNSLARWMLAVGLGAACRSGPAPGPDPGSDPSRSSTAEDVGRRLGRERVAFGRCYARERMNLQPVDRADYLVEVTVPAGGGHPEATIVERAVSGIETLEACLVDVIRRVEFRAPEGGPLVVDVPIRAPRS